MGWFKKKLSEAEAIVDFWRWWDGVRQEVADAIAKDGLDRFTKPFIDHVGAIHKDLEWELTPGTTAKHCLVVSPAGNPELRAAARRWLAQAPLVDETWEYQAVRLADFSVFESTMVMDSHRLEMHQIRYGIKVDKDTNQINVECYHPKFAELPPGMAEQVTMLSLDWAVGEEDVEIWIGEVKFVTTKPDPVNLPDDLRYAVASIATEDNWVIMSGESRSGVPIVAVVATPLRSARWPRFDLHVPVVLPYQRRNDELMPVDESLQALRDFEDRLDAAIGANGAKVAHESTGGVRTLHYYVDSETNAQAQIAEQLHTWSEGNATSKPVLDPAFKNVAHLMR